MKASRTVLDPKYILAVQKFSCFLPVIQSFGHGFRCLMVHMNGLDEGINRGFVTFHCRTIRKGAKTVFEQKNLIAI